MKQGRWRGSVRLRWAISSACGTVHHATVCSTDISRAAEPPCTTAIEMEWLQALGATKYLGKEKSNGQTNKGEELSLLSSAMRLRTASRSQEWGGAAHMYRGRYLQERQRENFALDWNTKYRRDRETIDTKCFATEKLSFSLSYCGAGVGDLHSITLSIQILSWFLGKDETIRCLCDMCSIKI